MLNSVWEKPAVKLLFVNPNHGKTGIMFTIFFHLEMLLMTTTNFVFKL
jgi:hypothetical protein